MARTVYVPEAGGALEFADGTTDQQIVDYVRSKYAPKPAPAPQEAGIGALESGFYGALGKVEAAGGKAAQGLGADWLASDLFDRARANEEYAAKYKPDVASVSDIQSAGDVAKFAGSTLGQSATESAVGIGGAYAGAVAGTAVFPGPGTLVGGIIGGAIASLPFFIGGNLQRQAQEQGIPLEETSGYDASAGAIAQAPLDAAFDTLIARKFPGAGATLDVVKKGFLKEVATTAGKGTLAEGLTEPAQQAIEIAQANPSKLLEFSPEVQMEILNAAAGGALAGGIIGGVSEPVSRAAQGIARSREEANKRQLDTDLMTAAVKGRQMTAYAEVNSGIESLASQGSIGRLRLNRVKVEPTEQNGLKQPVERFQIVNSQNKPIAEFSNAAAAKTAVATYSKISGKKINLEDGFTGQKIAVPKNVPEVKPPTSTVAKDSEKSQASPDLNPFGDGLKTAKIFKTALGSQYAVHGDGSTTRYKTQHPGHDPADVGLKPKSQATFYVRPEDVSTPKGGLDIINVQGLSGHTIIDVYKPGAVGVKYISGPDAGKFIPNSITKAFTQPEVGLTPVEIWNNGTGFHFGNKIVEVIDPPVSEPKPVTDDKNQPAIGSIETPEAVSETAAEDIKPAVEETPAPVEKVSVEAIAKEAPVVDEAAQDEIRRFIQDRKDKIAAAVRDSLALYNLKDVQTKFVPAFMDAMGKPVAQEGEADIENGKSIVTLASNIYDPNLTVEQMVDKVIDVLNHETVHSLFDLGLLRKTERDVLLNAVTSTKVPGKSYTYFDYAKRVYDPSRPGFEKYSDPEVVAEEAIAEMFRDWRKRNMGAPKNTRGLFNRVIESLRHMFNSMRRNRYEDIFTKVESGDVGTRERNIAKETSSKKFSVAPNLDNPDFRNWISGSKLVDENGDPLKLYTGTSKDVMFQSFKDGDRGIWVTTDPEQASNYAMWNDSMGHRLERVGSRYEYVKTNQASRVIPLYATAKNILDLSTREAQDEYMAKRGIKDFAGSSGYQKTQAAVGRYAVYEGYDAIQWGPNVWAIFNPKKNLKSQFNEFTAASIKSPKFSVAPEFPDLSVAPNYPYGQQVPEVNAAQINNALDHITYGAAVNMLDRVTKSRLLSSVIPESWRPSKENYTSFIQKFADRMLPVGQMVDYIKQNGGTVTDALDAYLAEELMHGKISDSLESREVDLYKPLIEHIRSSGISEQEIESYLYARHAKERNARIREINPTADPSVGSGMSDDEADQILSAVDASPNREAILEGERLFRAIIDDTNALRVESGLTPDFGNMVDEDGNAIDVPQYEFYAPLRGFADETTTEGEIDDDLRARIGQGFKIRGREDMRAMGRSSKATDIIAHAMLQNTEAAIRAAKNKVGQSFLSLVEANPELSEQYGVEVLTRGKKPLKRYISSKGVVKTMVDPMYKNRDDVMIVKRNGEEIPIRIDNRFLQKALLSKKSGSPDIAEKAVGFLQRANRFLAAMNTAYNPEFMLVNFPRDLQTAMVNITQYEIDGIQSKVLKDALPAARAVYDMLRDPSVQNDWTHWYNMFKEDGGKTSGFFGAFTMDDRLKRLEKMSQDISGQPSHRIKEAFNFVKGWLEDANGAFENAVRLSVYKNLREAGLSRERAAQAAKNLTVNFDKRGEYGPFLNSLYLFYNASVQGTLSMGMAMARSKKVRKVVAGIVVAGVLQDMINSLFSPEDEDGKKIYDKIPNYKLETNMILMDPFGLTKNGYIAIPLPYGFNAFWNMGRSMSRNLRGEYGTSEALTSMASTFVDAFNPIGGTESFLNFIAPTVLDPVVALSINQDFTGRKIYPEPFPGSVPKADSQMYWSTTSPLFKSTADFMNWATGGTEYVPGMIDLSPDVMEYIYDYMLGGVGAFARRIYDTGTSTVPAMLRGDLTEIEVNNLPVFRKLYGNVSTRITFEDYFEQVNHVLARGEELKSAIKSGDQTRVKAVRARFADELQIYPQIKALANRRNKIASDLRKLRENPRLPPEQKRKRQEVLQRQIEQITTKVNKLYEDKLGNKYPSLFS